MRKGTRKDKEMSSISKKTTSAKKRNGDVKSSRDGAMLPKKGGRGRTDETDDAERSLSQANEHMERAWEKIYARRGKGDKAA